MQNNGGSNDEFFLVTNHELSGSPPRRVPPSVPLVASSTILPSLSKSETFDEDVLSNSESSMQDTSPNVGLLSRKSMSVAESFSSNQAKELTVDDIEDFDDEDDLEVVDSRRASRRMPNDASDLVAVLPTFATGKYG